MSGETLSFDPSVYRHAQTRMALLGAFQDSGASISLERLFKHCVANSPKGLIDAITNALHAGHRHDELVAEVRSFTNDELSTESIVQCDLLVMDCISEFEKILSSRDENLEEISLEILLDCILRRLDTSTSLPINIDSAIANVRMHAQRKRTLNPNSDVHVVQDDDWIEISVGPESTQNLSRRISEQSELLSNPFAESESYRSVITDILRGFYRHENRHVAMLVESGLDCLSVFHELARRAHLKESPALTGRQILLLDLLSPETFDPRDSLAILHVTKDLHDVILIINGIEVAFNAGIGSSELLSALGTTAANVVMSIDPDQYREHIESHSRLSRQLTVVNLPEPDESLAGTLVRRSAGELQERFHLEIDEPAIDLAVRLSTEFVFGSRLPGKALDLLLRAGEELVFQREEQARNHTRLGIDDIYCATSALCGVPESTLRGLPEKTDYSANLSDVVFGQEEAVLDVATELSLIKTGLCESAKPASVMMFVGQTGTGKTELAKALARLYSNSKKLKTYTLGNFVEPHSVSNLIGVPPGYVGHEAGGALVNDLLSDPYGVFLLDEADKAHPDVLQPLLNLFDEGWIVDQRGTKAYARHAIFVLTTNVGQKMIADMVKQGKSHDEISSRMKEAMSQIKHAKANRPVFSPEFLARIGRIMVFKSLTESAMFSICQKLLMQIKDRWMKNRNKSLVVDDVVLSMIAKQAHARNEKAKGKEGGRIARKIIADIIEAPLQRQIGHSLTDYQQSNTIRVTLQADQARDGEALEVNIEFVNE